MICLGSELKIDEIEKTGLKILTALRAEKNRIEDPDSTPC
jgi:hypothetical protein